MGVEGVLACTPALHGLHWPCVAAAAAWSRMRHHTPSARCHTLPCLPQECATLYPEGSIDVLSSADWLAAQPGSTEFAAAAADQARRASLAGRSDEEEGMGGVQPPAPPLTSSSVDGARTAVEALDVAHRTTLMPGSSTACVVRLVPSSESGKALLDAANLGDSGFLLIRDSRLHFQSPAMQHFFDCPLQVGWCGGGGSAVVCWMHSGAPRHCGKQC